MKQAIILRGLPGSGKSTWIESFINALPSELSALTQRVGIFFTDKFFMVEGVYKFDKCRVKHYHRKNLAAFNDAAIRGVPIIICDNTNMQHWEYEPYIKIAKLNGYNVEVILIGEPNCKSHQLACYKRNTHNVGLSQIQLIAENYQK